MMMKKGGWRKKSHSRPFATDVGKLKGIDKRK
jgi:hypothetical protein